ncbi:MAG TPA: hypothetical protein VFS67_05465 [Polyangiaceae bacterium]|nr:hypothetical protein [Polyangiaceae bacterium]
MSTARAIMVTASANKPAISCWSSGCAAIKARQIPANTRLAASSQPSTCSDRGRPRASAHSAPITEAARKCIRLACVASAGRMRRPPPASSSPFITTKKPPASRNTVLPSSARRACTNVDPPQVSNPAPINRASCVEEIGLGMGAQDSSSRGRGAGRQ